MTCIVKPPSPAGLKKMLHNINIGTYGMYSTSKLLEIVWHTDMHTHRFLLKLCVYYPRPLFQISVIISRVIELDCGITHSNGWNRGNQWSNQLFSVVFYRLSTVQGQACFNDNYARTNGETEEMRTKDFNNRWKVICSSRATIMCMWFCMSSLNYCTSILKLYNYLTKNDAGRRAFSVVCSQEGWGGCADG